MHELSLCAAIAGTAIEHAAGRPVRRIQLRIGQFRQVVPETLQFCWELHSRGTELDGSTLEVDHRPVVIECHTCGATTTLDAPVLRCGECSGADVSLTGGDELDVVSIDVAPTRADEESH